MSYKAVEWDEMELNGGELLAKDRCLRAVGENERGFPKLCDIQDSAAGFMQGKGENSGEAKEG